MDKQQLLEQLATLRAENEKLRAKQPKAPGITLKVSQKGAVSIYGLGRFPVTLYREQLERLFSDDQVAKVRQFVVDNESALSVKAK